MKKNHGPAASPTAASSEPDGLAGDNLVALLRHSLDGVLVLDATGNILAANDAACRMTGYAIEELRTTTLDRLRAADPGDAHNVAFVDRIRDTGAARCDCSLRAKSGELREVEVTGTCAPGVGDRLFCFIRDVTARNRQQAALQESQEQLQVANARLMAAAEKSRELVHAAESANRAKSAFLASMSHELRTPLNVINGLAATMAEQATDSNEVHSAQLILESGQNLLSIIEELLDFSGLQAGKARLEPRALDLLGLVTQVVRQAGVMARRKGLGFTYRVRPNVPARVVGDPRRLQQVLLNLLGNAANYTQRGGVHFDVGGRMVDGRWRLVFNVADSGVGIAPADVAKLFQPFARAEFGQARQTHGTGLGLAIARSFAQLMGGDIAVRSRPGKGTVFRCSIETDETDGGAALASLAPPAGVAGRRVLLAFADRATRGMLADALRAWGLAPIVWHGPDAPLDRAEMDAGVDLAIVEAALGRNLSAMLNRYLQVRPPGRAAPVVWLTSPERQWPVPAAARAASVPLPLDLAELARAVTGLSLPAAVAAGGPDPLLLGERLPLRLLVADDIPTNREMLRRMLLHLGYKAQLVVNGAEAVEAVRLQPFDLVLLDVEMPVMNGLAAAREMVREHPDAARRPKIVALTANAQPGDRERCLAAGMDDYLSKPVLPSHIESCFLKLFRAEAPAEVPPADLPTVRGDLVDRDQLAAMFPGLPPPQVAEVLQQLQASAARDLDAAWPRLGEACANRNCARLAETAHGLKGCFTMLGWARLAAFCNEAIGQARAGEFTDWATFGPDLQRLHDLSTAEMECFLEELMGAGSNPLAAPKTDR